MNLSLSNSDQYQKGHCCICLNRQREKTPIWEQDYLLFRKIVKVAAISIACAGALYLLKTVCKAAYHLGQEDTKQEGLKLVTYCLNHETKEAIKDCFQRETGWSL